MSDPSDPWRKTTPPPAGRGPFLWLLLLAVVGVVVWLLAGEFPEAAASTDGKLRLIYLFLLVAILSSGLLARRRIRFRIAAKYTAIWAAIVLVLMLGYGYRFELRSVGQRQPNRRPYAFGSGRTRRSFPTGGDSRWGAGSVSRRYRRNKGRIEPLGCAAARFRDGIPRLYAFGTDRERGRRDRARDPWGDRHWSLAGQGCTSLRQSVPNDAFASRHVVPGTAAGLWGRGGLADLQLVAAHTPFSWPFGAILC